MLLRWTQRVIDLAGGDPSYGNFIIGCPLANALAVRGIARYSLGLPGWRDDQRQAVEMSRHADSLSYTGVIAYVYFPGVMSGMLRPDDTAMREIEDAVRIAERSGDDVALAFACMTFSVALLNRPTAADRERGQKLLDKVIEMYNRRGQNVGLLPAINVCRAREMVRRGDRDEAIPLLRAAADELLRGGRLQALGSAATGVLVETLVDRGADGDQEADLAEAEAAFERLAAASAEEGSVTREIWLVRIRALWRGHTVTRRAIANTGTVTETWRKLLASRGIATGRRRCRNGLVPLLRHARLPHPGSVKDQPKPLSRITRRHTHWLVPPARLERAT